MAPARSRIGRATGRATCLAPATGPAARARNRASRATPHGTRGRWAPVGAAGQQGLLRGRWIARRGNRVGRRPTLRAGSRRAGDAVEHTVPATGRVPWGVY